MTNRLNEEISSDGVYNNSIIYIVYAYMLQNRHNKHTRRNYYDDCSTHYNITLLYYVYYTYNQKNVYIYATVKKKKKLN